MTGSLARALIMAGAIGMIDQAGASKHRVSKKKGITRKVRAAEKKRRKKQKAGRRAARKGRKR